MNKIKKLEEEIIKHKAFYYSGNSKISDESYDLLEDELRKIDPNNFVLNIIGSSSSKNKIPHAQKMLSLEKTYELSDIKKWREDFSLLGTYKVDGSSCSIIYLEGKLILGKTRGDGSFGENISEKIYSIKDIPNNINIKDNVEIRGEIFCTDENFHLLSQEMESLKLEKPTSKRNIVAGILGRKEHTELCRFLSFQAFEFISESLNYQNEVQKFELLQALSFETPVYKLINKSSDIDELIEQYIEFLDQGNYLVDGLVFTYNDIAIQNQKGVTSHHPKYKIAYKFKGESKIVRVNSIIWQVSRNGILTPVAEVEPTDISGAMISRVTLHNLGQVLDYKLKKNDLIEIIRSGEVIPKFLSLKESSNEEFHILDKCPSCNQKLKIEEIRLICSNQNCPDKIIEEINYFVQNIGIEDLSRMRIKEMLDKQLITNISDIFKLNVSDILKMDKTKDKLAEKLFLNIQSVKEISLITFMSALGISGGGKNKCEKIVNNGFDTIDKILNLTSENLIKIDGFAKISSSDFIQSLVSKKKLILSLICLGFIFKTKKIINNPEIVMKKFCITGALTKRRELIEQEIKDNGGIIVSSVSAKTDYLVTNETDSKSSKFLKAQKLNVLIINESELEKLLSYEGQKSIYMSRV